jgi:hypothetical protein
MGHVVSYLVKLPFLTTESEMEIWDTAAGKTFHIALSPAFARP